MSERLFVSETIESEPRLRYLPVMITRLLLSLKKANAPQEHEWDLGGTAAHANVRLGERRGGIVTKNEMCLETFASMY